MKKIRLFEFEDLEWFPAFIRQGGTDYLRFIFEHTGFYNVAAHHIIRLLEKTNQQNILDLCSGSGGGLLRLLKTVRQITGKDTRIVLTDKFPAANRRYVCEKSGGCIIPHPDAVDAQEVPPQPEGICTMFTAIHHFQPAEIEKILKTLAGQRRGIAIFDGGNKGLLTLLALIILQPVSFVLFTPFIKPFSASRLFFTYLVPVIPLMTIWDGCASILKLYEPAELLTIATKAVPSYEWKSGYLKNSLGLRVCYLTGNPVQLNPVHFSEHPY